MRVLLMANFDSGLKLADRLAAAFREAGAAEVRIATPTTVAPAALGPDQIAASATQPVRRAPWAAIVADAAEADVVVPITDGSRVERFIRDVHHGAGRMPVVGACYVGLVLYDVVAGYLARSLADVVAVNSRTDLATFRLAADALGLDPAPLELTGLALLPAAPAPRATGPIRSVLFADQPSVPGSAVERAALWDRLADYAVAHPARTVILRPRHRPGETTFHPMRHSPVDWARRRVLPSNLRIDHAPIGELLHRSDLVLTVSSTAAVEGVALGKRVALVADVVNDAALNPPLIPSGLLRRFDDIEADRLGEPTAAWLDDVFPAAGGADPAARFATRLMAVAAGEEPRHHQALWDSPFHLARRRSDSRAAALASAVHRRSPRSLAAAAARRVATMLDGS